MRPSGALTELLRHAGLGSGDAEVVGAWQCDLGKRRLLSVVAVRAPEGGWLLGAQVETPEPEVRWFSGPVLVAAPDGGVDDLLVAFDIDTADGWEAGAKVLVVAPGGTETVTMGDVAAGVVNGFALLPTAKLTNPGARVIARAAGGAEVGSTFRAQETPDQVGISAVPE